MVKLRAKEGKLGLFLEKVCCHSAENCQRSSIWLHIEILVLCGEKEARRAVRSVVPPLHVQEATHGWGMGRVWKELPSQTNGRACPQQPVHQSGTAISPGLVDKVLLGKATEAAQHCSRD